VKVLTRNSVIREEQNLRLTGRIFIAVFRAGQGFPVFPEEVLLSIFGFTAKPIYRPPDHAQNKRLPLQGAPQIGRCASVSTAVGLRLRFLLPTSAKRSPAAGSDDDDVEADDEDGAADGDSDPQTPRGDHDARDRRRQQWLNSWWPSEWVYRI